MANTTIKITQLPNIGNNLAGNTLLPVVDTSGSAVTDKLTVGNLGNFILTEAGNTLQPAFVSQVAYSVANAAQPNITSVGVLTSLAVSDVSNFTLPGGTDGYVLQTDGTGNLNWTAMAGSGNGNPGGANSQIQYNDNGLFGGSTGFTFDADSNILAVPGSIVVGSGNAGIMNWSSTTIGFTSDSVNDLTGIYLVKDSEAQIYANTSVQIYSDSSNNAYLWSFGQNGNLTLPTNTSSINYANGQPYSGISTGNIGFTANAIYSLGGVIVENADLSHGATAALVLPDNGNTATPVQVTNTYGNVQVTTGITAGSLKNWVFDNTGNFSAPGNVSVVGNANIGNIGTAGIVTATGNITGGNIITDGLITATGTIRGGTLYATGTGTAVNASSGNILTNEVTGTKFNFLNGAFTASVNAGATADYTLTLPTTAGASGEVLTTDGTGNLSWSVSGTSNQISATSGGDSANLTIDPYLNLELNYNGNTYGSIEFDGGDDMYITDRRPGGNIYVQTRNNADSQTLQWTFNSDGNLQLPSTGYITAPLASSGATGYNVSIQAGASDASTWNSNPGGDLTLKGGYGSFADGGGGRGGNVYVAGGDSSDNQGGNVHISGGDGTSSGSIFLDDDTYTSPVNSGDGTGENALITGTRRVIGGVTNPTYAYTTVLYGNTAPVMVYQSGQYAYSAKVTFAVQSNNVTWGWEQFDVVAVRNVDGGATISVSNRVNSNPANGNTSVTALLNGATGAIQIYLQQPGPGTAYVTYDAVEFNLMVD